MAQLSQVQKEQLKAIMKESKPLKARLQAYMTKPDTKTSDTECSRYRVLNIRWKKLSNTQTGWRDSQEIKLGGT